jgi:ubiquinone/menaquinone biosynthesis C-methylase UbiE
VIGTWIGRRFARLTTDAVVRRPRLWPLFRGLMRRQFDMIAPGWDAMRSPGHLAPLEAALAAVGVSPDRVLDVGTGTGAAAIMLAERFPDGEVIGVDLSERMLSEARRNLPPQLASRVRFESADAAALPYEDSSFELVTLANMIPFFDELARVVKPGGRLICSFSSGATTPIYVPAERLRDALERRGFTEFANIAAASGTAFVARKGDRS